MLKEAGGSGPASFCRGFGSRKRIAIKLETKARSRRSVAKESSPVKQKTSSTPQRKDQQRRTVKKRPVYSSGSESCEQDDV